MKYQKCFYCESTSSIIDAHTIQKSIVDKFIASNGKNREVTSFCIKDNFYQKRNIGWKKASTYNCFCKECDNRLFQPIENGNKYCSDNKNHLFLHTLRSFSYCYFNSIKYLDPNGTKHDKNFTGKTFEVVKNPEYLINKDLTYNSLKIHLSTYESTRKMFVEEYSNKIDRGIIGSYNHFDFCYLDIPHKIPITSCGILEANLIPDNTDEVPIISIQNDSPIINQPIFILTVFPSDNKTHIILGYDKMDNNSIYHIKNINKHYDGDDILKMISGIIFKNCQNNTFIHPNLWKSFSENRRNDILNEMSTKRPSDSYTSGLYKSKINLFDINHS